MKFFIDTADIKEINDLMATGMVDGVTTNPSLAAKSGKKFVDLIADRADKLGLAVRGREASTLIELTAFGTAVVMNYRYTDDFTGERPSE